MEAFYNNQKETARQILKKINPLSSILTVLYIRTLVPNTGRFSSEVKRDIRAIFRRWARRNHPDVWEREEVTDQDRQDVGRFVMTIFGSTITGFKLPSNNDMYFFMIRSLSTFHCLDIEHMDLNIVSRIRAGINNLITFCGVISAVGDITEQLEMLRNIFNFFDKFYSVNKVCMTHSTENQIIDEGECTECNPIIIEDSSGDEDETDNIDGNALDEGINERELQNIRHHRKRMNTTRFLIPYDTWTGCIPINVNELPRDIDGLCVYIIGFDPLHRMRSSRDGRRWKQSMTSNRKRHNGIRRIANCLICRHVRKIWEFNDETCMVSVYHYGIHYCIVN